MTQGGMVSIGDEVHKKENVKSTAPNQNHE